MESPKLLSASGISKSVPGSNPVVWVDGVPVLDRAGRPNGRAVLVTHCAPARKHRGHESPAWASRGQRSLCFRHRSHAYRFGKCAKPWILTHNLDYINFIC
ncbi:hypothetical protein CIHG_04438 [Coccidioides immitis H538.4]|uniref:Uncharacterized protein n=3 Tax=Coccidioides immitis TaxID=5501 RepID=A0A0J8U2E0_COCIT|nr:hypothetical protein CIRG_09372 [Coccidioides immitis RMSCC 2394]KMU80792.1 hypothetical protein CISG_08595 [Coccidioides immitis RMSCC 3703]KMU86649.1 hypothetical protein CIHG_04438 [Coccidioides immitis H538.4]